MNRILRKLSIRRLRKVGGDLPNSNRTGFSIIEVLASIAVALIGVLGVLILVPYAVRMSATGLDIESALTVFRNSVHQFDIEGYRNDRNWLAPDLNPDSPTFGQLVTVDRQWTLPTLTNPVLLPPATPFSIDPLGITEHPSGIANLELHVTGFPFNALPAPFPYQIPPANVIQRDPNNSNNDQPLNRAAANRVFRARDDLVFGDAMGDFDGPNQIFDTVGNDSIRRQTESRFSWSALVFPQQRPYSYIVRYLIYKNRQTNAELTDLPGPIDYAQTPHMRYALVEPPTFMAPAGTSMPVSTIQLAPGAGIPEGSIRKDDWVMLINQRRPGVVPKFAWDWQVGFYRVINFQNTPGGAFITVAGDDPFDFNPASHEQTYVVHLKNVVFVTESKDFRSESQSDWNLFNF